MRYQSTTGLSSHEIAEVVTRIRQVVGSERTAGRPVRLGLYRQVVLVLVVLRQNMSQTTVADLFGVSQPTVSRILRRLLPLLEEVTCMHAPVAESVFHGRVVLVDGTDVPTGNRAGAAGNYSGKRHRAGVNIQIAADTQRTLLAVSDPVPGARHDRRAITDNGWETILGGVCWIADPAYQGTTAITPTKRPIHGELTDNRKDANADISGIRSAVERCIAHLKNWKILATGYRGRLSELPNLIRIITKLEYYRLGW